MKRLTAMLAIAAVVLTSCSKDNDKINIDNNDTNFAIKAWIANKAEIELGQLAIIKATDTSITDFAQSVVAEQNDAKSQLQAVAQQLNIALPDSLDADNVAIRAQMIDLNGRPFDSVYITNRAIQLQRTVTLYQTELNEGLNESLRLFALTELPKLQAHLQVADSIAANY